jgi:SAM-dependent methyltransferase
LDPDQLRQEVRSVYARVAQSPEGDFHFHRGPEYAAEQLDYDANELAELPPQATASFAGVGNPLAIDRLEPGQVVVDIGSGSGMDLLLAARRVGPEGKAIGVDMTDEMLASARRSAEAMGANQVELRKGDLLDLPLESDSVDVVISNGVLNLSPDKIVSFSEIARVLRPGGRLLLADIIMGVELDEAARSDIDLWAG